MDTHAAQKKTILRNASRCEPEARSCDFQKLLVIAALLKRSACSLVCPHFLYDETAHYGTKLILARKLLALIASSALQAGPNPG